MTSIALFLHFAKNLRPLTISDILNSDQTSQDASSGRQFQKMGGPDDLRVKQQPETLTIGAPEKQDRENLGGYSHKAMLKRIKEMH